MDQTATLSDTDEDAGTGARRWKDRLRVPLMIFGPLLLLLVIGFFYITGGRYQSTNDAYVQQAKVLISANVEGRVREIAVHDNQAVHQGDLLFRLDEAPFQIAVAEARAQEELAILNIGTLKATYKQREAELRSARDTLAFRQREYDRQRRLLSSGISSQLQLDNATHALQEAQAGLAAAEEQLNSAKAALQGNPDIAPERHPSVLQARARLDRANLNLSYTTVRAPSDGIVTRVEELQVGSYIKASEPLFALVSNTDIWVEANFKEDQLTYLRAGQPAEVTIDRYGGHKFAGTVASLAPGTGSTFSLLPAENATGNWVKVVQRVPVRIHLSHLDAKYPISGGLSAEVTVDTRHHRTLFGGAQTANAGESTG